MTDRRPSRMSQLSQPTTNITRNSDSSVEAYSRFIRSCFARYPASAPYYQQLINYIQHGKGKGNPHLRQPRCYDIPNRHGQSFGGQMPVVYTESSLETPHREPRILILDGFPAPEHVSLLGAQYSPRPELFIGHLDFTRDFKRPQYNPEHFFEIPSLPSLRSNLTHVRLITMGRAGDAAPEIKSYASQRVLADKKCLAFEQQLFRGKYYGLTRFRDVHIHDSQNFSVEQTVSFSVLQPQDQAWCGIFLRDEGTSLAGKHDIPWADYIPSHIQKPLSVPVIPYNCGQSTDENLSTTDFASAAYAFESLHSYDPKDHMYAEDTIDFILLREEPFFHLSRLFSVAALSWSQYLNYIEKDVKACSELDKASLNIGVEQLRFNSILVAKVDGFLKENFHSIEDRGSSSWPRSTDLEAINRMNRTHKRLLKDYSFLLQRCTQISAQCDRNSDTLVNTAQALAAEKDMLQARQVANLTLLAFIFIPLSYVSSIFGMNISNFQKQPPLWVYFAFAIPFTVLVFVGFGAVFQSWRIVPILRAAWSYLLRFCGTRKEPV